MNKIKINNKTSFDDAFDRVIIRDEHDSLYIFDCDSRTAPNYKVALMPAFEKDDDIIYSPDTVIYSCVFYAVDELNKRGMLSSMLAVLELENDLSNPMKLQREFGGVINGLYERSGKA